MTPSLKALIEQQAIKFAEKNEDVITNIHSYRTGNDLWKGYEAGATPYAEKLEAAEQENKRLREILKKIEKESADVIDGKLINTEVKSDMALYNIKWAATEALKPTNS